jgi:hypothetical protein
MGVAVAPFAISYQVMPELRRAFEGWEVRGLVAAVGLVTAYALIRTRKSCGASAPTWWRTVIRLGASGVVAAGLWVAVDVVRGEDFLRQAWEALPEGHENVVRAVVILGAGWAGWTVALSEGARRVSGR